LTVKNFGHFVSKLPQEIKSKAYSVKAARLMAKTKFRCSENAISKPAGGFLKQKVLPGLSPLRKKKCEQFSLLLQCVMDEKIVPLRKVFKVDKTG
jgi:hypothetical protein